MRTRYLRILIIGFVIFLFIFLSNIVANNGAFYSTSSQINSEQAEVQIQDYGFYHIYNKFSDIEDNDVVAEAPILTSVYSDSSPTSDYVVQNDMENIIDDSDVGSAYIMGKALPYPNPMNFSDGNGIIYYKLSKSVDVELRVYNMAAQLIYKKFLPENTEGGRGGSNSYNHVPFNPAEVGERLSIGTYFFILVHNNSVLGKGKIAVIG